MKGKFQTIGRFVLGRFILAVTLIRIAFGAAGRKMRGFSKGNTKKIIIAKVILCLLVAYIASGIVLVSPQTVKVVRYPDRLDSNALMIFEKPVPVVNDTNGVAIRYVCPRIWYIPGVGKTDIGIREESYSLSEPIKTTTRIELFDVYRITGDPADKDKVAYLVVSGDFEVTDWETFLLTLDPKMVKEEFQNMTRSELLAYNVGMYLFAGNINNWYAESISRTYLADKFAKEYNLKTEEEIEYFIKVYRSWYWSLGAMHFHYFEEEVMRNPFPSQFGYEFGMRCVMAASIENAIASSGSMLNLFQGQKAAFYEDLDPAVIEKAEAIVAAFKEYLKEQGLPWPISQPKMWLSDFLIKNQMKGVVYSGQELYAARVLVDLEAKIDYQKGRIEQLNEQAAQAQQFFRSLRLWYSKGNDSLWRFAIQRVVKGEGYPKTGDFYTWFKTDGTEYLAELAEFYQELGLFESMGVKFNNITFTIEEVVKEAPGK